MSFIDKLKKRVEEVKDVAEQKIIELKLDAPDREARMDICRACPELFKPTASCMKCGCFVHAKTWLKNEKCPVGKW
jgi:hypothetical protein